MITLVDYGLGNIQAFANIYKRLNIPCRVAKNADELAGAERIILPGVGAFDWAMSRLEKSGMRACLDDLVLNGKRPVLGICVGMQMMARRSDEGELAGLGWIDAEVRKLGVRGEELGDWSKELGDWREELGGRREELMLPHMGWNDVRPVAQDSLFRGIDGPRFYFLHSYYFAPNNPADVLAVTDYNGSYASAVRAGNVFGVQFHPEKSHQWGIRLLSNFAEI